MNIEDALAAAHVLVQKIVQKTGISIRLKSCIYEDNASIMAGLKDHKLDIITVLPEDLPELINHDLVDPYLISVQEGSIYENYILCMRTDIQGSGLKSLADKTLTISVWLESNLPGYWLALLLNEKHLSPANSFFSRIDRIEKPEQAIMRVFFGKSDACLVPKRTFLILSELNPQILQEIIIVEESPNFINAVLCLNKSLTERDYRSTTEMELLKLKQEPGGEQMMALFKIDNFLPYNESYLRDTFEMIKQYQALKR